MVEKQRSALIIKKPVRQQGTVPFLWEEKPGTPKKDWKPEIVSVNSAPPPVKLVTTVPFKWEEKPGTPFPSFSYPQKDSPHLSPDSPLPLPPGRIIGCPPIAEYSPCSSPKSPGMLFSKLASYDSDGDDISEADNGEENDSNQEDGAQTVEEYEKVDDDNEDFVGEEEMFELDFEVPDFNESEYLKSAPFLLANCCISKETISNAVPVDQDIQEEENSHPQHETPKAPSSERESYFDSYATGGSNLNESSFIECFFPQFSPEPGYINKVHYEERCSPTLAEPSESNLTKRTPTLGELIRVSCRGYGRSSLHTRKQNPSFVILVLKLFIIY
ncbi:hypothetical protein FRX31_034974 [Thalictrum thalictroides]|uniref:Hydroxyproline-rich glycoprotein family protein n=1 Tax=Thalictrum thalictroides TaxID=46969 RepID=A0A7J6USF8_THATH|nr:hypothetical protein FRX31_034974 [Thalictrum thalictroides]